jgi:hypothetical protein
MIERHVIVTLIDALEHGFNTLYICGPVNQRDEIVARVEWEVCHCSDPLNCLFEQSLFLRSIHATDYTPLFRPVLLAAGDKRPVHVGAAQVQQVSHILPTLFGVYQLSSVVDLLRG